MTGAELIEQLESLRNLKIWREDDESAPSEVEFVSVEDYQGQLRVVLS